MCKCRKLHLHLIPIEFRQSPFQEKFVHSYLQRFQAAIFGIQVLSKWMGNPEISKTACWTHN